MNTLRRKEFRADGIFGEFFFDGESSLFMVTLEHAFAHSDENGVTYHPVIPPGEYTCKRGTHRLHDGIPFETFEITGVSGHSGLLFHVGNFNRDSEGCVLCGAKEVILSSTEKIVSGSHIEFEKFMSRFNGVDEWKLKVE